MSEEIRDDNLTGLEVAVIGIAGKFPGAWNIEQFWDNLKNGVESISFFTNRELQEEGIEPDLLKMPNYIKAKGILSDIESFDAYFFNYSPREAEIMDPQMRLFHVCCWEALENAGYNPDAFKGPIGIYAGASLNLPWLAYTRLIQPPNASAWLENSTLNDVNYLGTRISYKFNLKGPSVIVQTACSTSLVAIALAFQGLLSGECDMALAGGVAIKLPQKFGYLYYEGMVNSPDGHCRAFDTQARGFVGGNGMGVVLLKRYSEAAVEGDHIHAIILGSAVNNDGIRKVAYTAPSVEGQVEVIRVAHRMAGVEPESVTYIETHGTGTILGDPLEVEALKKAFNTNKKGICGIGSVKTNIGHLDTAAGIAGFIKAVLALKHKMLPPSLNFNTPNPRIDFINSPFYVTASLTPWANKEYPLRAGVSSFGIGGTNVHMVLQEAPVHHRKNTANPARSHQLIVVSTKTESSLNRMMKHLEEYLQANPGIPIDDVAYTLQVGRKACKRRRMLVVSGQQETIAALEAAEPGTFHSSLVEEKHRPVVFRFAGMVSGYEYALKELHSTVPLFRRSLDHCLMYAKHTTRDNLRSILRGAKQEPEFAEKENRSFMEFAFQYALAKSLLALGIRPDAIIGESVGEYAAAHLAGVFSLEDALNLAIHQESWRENRELEERIREMTLNQPGIPYVSTRTGNWITNEEVVDPGYWSGYLIAPAPMTESVAQFLEEQEAIVVEMNPHGKSPGEPALKNLLLIIGQLWLHGKTIDWLAFYGDEKRNRIPLPTYPFEFQSFSVDVSRLKVLLKRATSSSDTGLLPEELPTPVSTRKLYSRPELKTEYTPPGNKMEQILVDMWQELFGIEPIGIHDDFFELGGDSLKGISFVNRYREMLAEIVHITVVFEAPTIAQLNSYLRQNYPRGYWRIMGIEREETKDEPVIVLTNREIDEVRELLSSGSSPKPGAGSKNSPMIFIFSAARTGSTLLRVILAGHPGLFAPPELNLLSYDHLEQRRETYTEGFNTFLQGTLRAIMEIKGASVEEAGKIIKELEDQQVPTWEFYRLMQQWLGDRRLVDKSTAYALNRETLKLAELYFQQPLYIHLVRHPYGTIRSYEEARIDLFMNAQLRENLTFTPRQLGELNWTISNLNIIEFLKDIPRERQYCLKFEDLVHHPKDTIRGLCQFLGVEFVPEMLQPYKERKLRMTDGVYNGGMMLGDMKFHQHRDISTGPAESWRSHYKNDFWADMTREIATFYGYQSIDEQYKIRQIPEIEKIRRHDVQQSQQLMNRLDQLSDEEVELLLKKKMTEK
ncbi:MAG: beta-ketoacyl synthase N-terminal-like domain-containing protein [Candidatus Aminicenantes bacterium]|jgi:3-oxoacyl-(acyl-carrier-protein) synthase